MLHHRDRQLGLQLGQVLPLGRGKFQGHGPVHEAGFVLVAQDPLQVPVDQGADSGIGAVFSASVRLVTWVKRRSKVRASKATVSEGRPSKRL